MFEKLISPVIAIKMLKTGIEKTLNQPIQNFDIVYNGIESQVYFRVYNVLINGERKEIFEPYKGANAMMLNFAVKGILKTHLKPGETLDLAIGKYHEENNEPFLDLEICITKDGKKEKHSVSNYKPNQE